MSVKTAQNQSTLKNREVPLENPRVKQVQVLVSWKAPSRVFVTRSRSFWVNTLSIAGLFGLIFLLIQEWLLVVVIAALVFVFYVYSTVPPDELEHQITTRGVRYGDREYRWEELAQFWISESYGQKILNLATYAMVPGRLEILLGEIGEETIRKILRQYLLEETPPPGFLDKASNFLAKKFPLDIS
jgi:hypothetical protein